MKTIHKETINGYQIQVWDNTKTSTCFEVAIINDQNNYQAFTLPTKEMAFNKVNELKKGIQHRTSD